MSIFNNYLFKAAILLFVSLEQTNYAKRKKEEDTNYWREFLAKQWSITIEEELGTL